nr:hypothetical protein [Halobaculum salinum]
MEEPKRSVSATTAATSDSPRRTTRTNVGIAMTLVYEVVALTASATERSRLARLLVRLMSPSITTPEMSVARPVSESATS